MYCRVLTCTISRTPSRRPDTGIEQQKIPSVQAREECMSEVFLGLAGIRAWIQNSGKIGNAKLSS